MPKAIAVVDHVGLRDETDCYKEIRIGKSLFKEYSQKALGAIKKALKEKTADQIWEMRKSSARGAAS